MEHSQSDPDRQCKFSHSWSLLLTVRCNEPSITKSTNGWGSRKVKTTSEGDVVPLVPFARWRSWSLVAAAASGSASSSRKLRNERIAARSLSKSEAPIIFTCTIKSTKFDATNITVATACSNNGRHGRISKHDSTTWVVEEFLTHYL